MSLLKCVIKRRSRLLRLCSIGNRRMVYEYREHRWTDSDSANQSVRRGASLSVLYVRHKST